MQILLKNYLVTDVNVYVPEDARGVEYHTATLLGSEVDVNGRERKAELKFTASDIDLTALPRLQPLTIEAVVIPALRRGDGNNGSSLKLSLQSLKVTPATPANGK